MIAGEAMLAMISPQTGVKVVGGCGIACVVFDQT